MLTGQEAALAGLLLLADGRFPAGGHVHSGGAEAALADGRITGPGDLESFVIGRIHTTGLVDAALTAATVVHLTRATANAPGNNAPGGVPDPGSTLLILDAEANSRIGVAPMRESSRRLGRQLTRAAANCWPGPAIRSAAGLHPDGPHQSVALGAVAFTAGIGPGPAAVLSLHHTLTTPLQAALRLGGLDPYAVAAMAASLAPLVAEVAHEATTAAVGPPADLPCAVGPLTEIAAVEHSQRHARLFAT